MIIERMRADINDSMRSQDRITANILKLALTEASKDGTPSDDGVLKACKKLVEANELTLKYREDEKLRIENIVLRRYLPQTKTADKETIGMISTEIMEDVIACKSDGQAIGLVSKRLKAAGFEFNSSDVREVVELMRS